MAPKQRGAVLDPAGLQDEVCAAAPEASSHAAPQPLGGKRHVVLAEHGLHAAEAAAEGRQRKL